jgi:hypothetical protein
MLTVLKESLKNKFYRDLLENSRLNDSVEYEEGYEPIRFAKKKDETTSSFVEYQANLPKIYDPALDGSMVDESDKLIR